MLKKFSKSPFMTFVKRSAGVLIVAETAAFIGSYYLWYKLNTNQGKIYNFINFVEIS